MWTPLTDLFQTRGFPPRWSCGLAWAEQPWWGWLHIGSDIAIWAAYTAIPLVLWSFLRLRPKIPFSRIFLLFAAFILCCGATHLIEALLFYWPAYRLSAVVKFITAVVSWATVVALIPVIPKALSLRSPAELEEEIQRRMLELRELTVRLDDEAAARADAANSLLSSQTRLRLALLSGEMGTWDWDLTTNLVRLDEVEQKLLGLTDLGTGVDIEEIFGVIHEDDVEPVRAEIQAVIEERRDYRMEFRLRREGNVRWLAGRGRIISEEDGRNPHLVGINFDITERRQTQENLLLRTRAVESATNSILIVDLEQPDAPAIYSNQSFTELTGYNSEETIGRNCRFLQGPDTDPQTVAELRHAIQERREASVRILNYRKDGTRFWNDLRISPVKSNNGIVTHYVGFMNDVTTQVEVEKEMQQAREIAESASQAKSDFLANMSHEIRTPLTAILGCADTLYRQPLNEDALSLVRMVRDQGELLLGILNDVLDLSKIEAGKLEVRLQPSAIHTIIADIHSLMLPQAIERGLTFQIRYGSAIPAEIETDPLRLRQILLNLTSNAVKFTPQGKVEIRVHCDIDTDPAILSIDVLDTGIGIPPTKLEEIFEPFTQVPADSARQRTRGTGLGLTICRRLVALLGGRLSVRSITGEGSRFTVRLPIGSPARLEMRQPEELERSVVEEVGKASLHFSFPCRVLIAEDTRGLQFMLKRMLEDFVASVIVVSNGQEAIDAVKQADSRGEPIDLILMDMQMPIMNGFEATSQLRSCGFSRPIVALTAGAMAGDREKCLAAGCSEYLTKPVDHANLLAILLRYFSR